MKLREYQVKLSNDGVDILRRKKIVYLAMEVRTGKTLTALNIAELYGAKKVLFLTKKKAIDSIRFDYDNYDNGFNFKLIITNDESLHLLKDKDFDLVIHDEHHRFGAYPKPNVTAKLFKERFSHLPMVFLSGTPTPESHSQWFHQMWVSDYSPFKDYTNFYKWANDYVDVKQKHLGYAKVNDYSHGIEKKIKGMLRHFILTFTQKEAGFTTSVNEQILEVEMKPITYQIIDRLKTTLVVKNKYNQIILGDTGAKLLQKIHQLCSGTCKFEDGTSKVIDYSKIEYIYENFKDYKIAIFYKYQEELNAIQSFLGDKVTTNLDEFNSNKNLWFAIQMVTGREGISLKEAQYLVYYNIDYSATTYWQSRDRLTTMDRTENTVFWIFAKGGIEDKIYREVQKKKSYTSNIFIKEYGIRAKFTEKDTKEATGRRLALYQTN